MPGVSPSPETPPWLAALYRQVHADSWAGPGLSPFNHLLMVSVALAVLVQVLETEPSLRVPYATWFDTADLIIGSWFCLDFCLRVVAAGADPRHRGWRGHLRYFSDWRIWMDLLAVLPFLLHSWVEGLGANDLAFLRLLQGFKVVRAARLGRLGEALAAFQQALRARRYELLLSFLVALAVMLVAAILLYLAEGKVQPAAFGSVPRALWWSLETLTTVGYGDVAPVTSLGRFLAGLMALVGIGVIALPTGILAAAFSDAFQRRAAKRAASHQDEDRAPG